MTDHTAPASTSVTVDLGAWAVEVDAYATRHDLSREAAVVALVRDALTRGQRNHLGHAAEGSTVVQTGGDIHGGLQL